MPPRDRTAFIIESHPQVRILTGFALKEEDEELTGKFRVGLKLPDYIFT